MRLGERNPGQPECPALQRFARVPGVLLFAPTTYVSNSAFIFFRCGSALYFFSSLSISYRVSVRHIQENSRFKFKSKCQVSFREGKS